MRSEKFWCTVLVALLCAGSLSAQQRKSIGEFSATFLPPHIGNSPRAVRVSGNYVYVVSRADHAVSVYTKDMEFVRRIGRIGNGPGELMRPSAVDIEPDGSVWVADEGNNRVQKFDADGRFLSMFASKQPQHLRRFHDGVLGVVEVFAEPIVRLYRADGSVAGEIKGHVEVPGATPKQIHYFNRPVMSELADGSVVVAAPLIVPPRIRLFRRNGSVVAEAPLPVAGLEALIDEAVARQREMITKGRYGGRSVINDVEAPARGEYIWIAPSAEGLFRYSTTTATFDYFDIATADGLRIGTQDFDFIAATEIIGISGKHCFRAKLR
jgi:hypothetical protein